MAYQSFSFLQTSHWALLMRAGRYCYHNRNYALSEVYFIAAVCEALECGHFRAAVSKALHWWALSCREQGKYAKAQRLFAQSYRVRQENQHHRVSVDTW